MGEAVVGYPRFSARLGAWLIDAAILFALALPVTLKGIWTLSFEEAATVTVGFTVVGYGYKIVTQAQWGQTIGKRVIGIRLRMKDGSPVRWLPLLVRYLPGLLYAGLYVAGWLLTVRSAGWFQLQLLPPAQRAELMNSSAPFWWPGLLDSHMYAWILANAIALKASSRNRALHDMIAGTTVHHAKSDPG